MDAPNHYHIFRIEIERKEENGSGIELIQHQQVTALNPIDSNHPYINSQDYYPQNITRTERSLEKLAREIVLFHTGSKKTDRISQNVDIIDRTVMAFSFSAPCEYLVWNDGDVGRTLSLTDTDKKMFMNYIGKEYDLKSKTSPAVRVA